MKQLAFNNHNITLLDNQINDIETAIHDKIDNLKFKKMKPDKFKRLNISIPIDLYNELIALKAYGIKLKVSKICQAGIRKQLDKIKENKNHLQYLETRKNLFEFEVKQIEYQIKKLLNE